MNLRFRQPRVEDPKHLKFIRELLDYDPETGEFVWRRNRGGAALAGTRAGWSRSDGYRMISIYNRKLYAHRLAWAHVHDEWPASGIDHVNGDPSDNRISNLRPATQSQNLTNARLRTDNRSGYKGVSWSARDKRWKAFIRINKKTVALGSFSSAEEAYAAYCAQAQTHYGQFWRPE